MQTIDNETGMIVTDDHAIVPLSEVETFLATRPPVDAAKELRDRLTALCTYYKGKVETLRELQEGQLRVERYIGTELAKLPRAQGKRNDMTSFHNGTKSYEETIDELDIAKTSAFRLQQLAAVPEERFNQYIAQQKNDAARIVKADLLTDTNRKVDHQLINQSTNNEWYTPRPFLDAAHEVMGGIDLDPASNPMANVTVRAVTFFSQADDGLAHQWYGRVWLNPPYGDYDSTESNQAHWSRRLVDDYQSGNVSEAILLVNAVTGNIWWRPLKKYPICFPDSRIRFYNEETEAGQPTHGNALIYFGENIAAFVRVFSHFGAVMMPVQERDGRVLLSYRESDE